MNALVNRFSTLIALAMLALMALLMVSSGISESAIMDELPHIPAGYAYVARQDYRLNPEHPPLVKMLAGIPLLALNLNFPDAHQTWSQDINGQWDFGREFFYHAGNNPDQILFWARLAPIGITAILGWFVFRWTKERAGNLTGLLALALFAFNPVVLAHGKYVTTDLGAAAGAFIASYFFLRFLSLPQKKNVILAGTALGLALLLKFTIILLIPYFAVLTLCWIFLRLRTIPLREHVAVFLGAILVGFIALAVLYAGYLFTTWQYPAAPDNPADRAYLLSLKNCDGIDKIRYPVSQFRDTVCTLKTLGVPSVSRLTIWMSTVPVLRPLGQYLLGLLMVTQRVAGGNTGYFLGDVSNAGWLLYFPVVYFLKMPPALHLLTLLAVIAAAFRFSSTVRDEWALNAATLRLRSGPARIRGLLFTALKGFRDHFAVFAMLLFIALYTASSIKANLNIGVRHLLPIFPFVVLLVSEQVIAWVRSRPKGLYFAESLTQFGIRGTIVFGLTAWVTLGTLLSYPHFMAYFNELTGGAANGYRYVVDSNLDWGQDLKWLARFVNERGIEKISVHYFGGGDAGYYLSDRVENWWFERGKPERWFAISATLQQNALGKPDERFVREVTEELRFRALEKEILLPEEALRFIAENANFEKAVAHRHLDRILGLENPNPTLEEIRSVVSAHSYDWLRDLKPQFTIGHSIFLYYVP